MYILQLSEWLRLFAAVLRGGACFCVVFVTVIPDGRNGCRSRVICKDQASTIRRHDEHRGVVYPNGESVSGLLSIDL